MKRTFMILMALLLLVGSTVIAQDDDDSDEMAISSDYGATLVQMIETGEIIDIDEADNFTLAISSGVVTLLENDEGFTLTEFPSGRFYLAMEDLMDYEGFAFILSTDDLLITFAVESVEITDEGTNMTITVADGDVVTKDGEEADLPFEISDAMLFGYLTSSASDELDDALENLGLRDRID
jgi:hypothetical protein